MTFDEVRKIYSDLACANNFWIRPYLRQEADRIANGHTTLFTITITTAACAKYNKDEMALLLGHELGHWCFKHIFTDMDDYEKEYEADRKGAFYLIKAGYSLKNAITKFTKMGQKSSKSHPHPKDRMKALLSLIEE